MNEIIVTAVFDVESEAYQALSEVRRSAIGENFIVSQIALVKNEGGHIVTKDWFDTGVETRNDTALGGVLGSFIGILGGPLGIILGGSIGLLVGSAIDADDMDDSTSAIERVSNQIVDGETALVALVQEKAEGSFVAGLSNWKTNIVVNDAAEVAAEVERAEQVQKEMAKAAKKQMREEKKSANKEKVAEYRNKIKEQFNNLMN